ncbi:hypothetical protein ACLB0R_00470 [Sphingomonas sp. GlSt437]|uniref:hypothetical protein n=1 Tax=Sphingomonas sp. GlSt437 TaxID=3389970 RepID=UPI003A862C01
MTNDISDTAQAMQRIKVGVTGLAAVLLLILLASAVLSWASKEKPVAVAGSAKPDVVANMTQANASTPADAPAKEPLAELGVAPSAAPGGAANSAAPASRGH